MGHNLGMRSDFKKVEWNEDGTCKKNARKCETLGNDKKQCTNKGGIMDIGWHKCSVVNIYFFYIRTLITEFFAVNQYLTLQNLLTLRTTRQPIGPVVHKKTSSTGLCGILLRTVNIAWKMEQIH